jgi:hypothetical protein
MKKRQSPIVNNNKIDLNISVLKLYLLYMFNIIIFYKVIDKNFKNMDSLRKGW